MAKLEGFISWSGARSECLARRINEWVPIMVPDVRLFFSPRIAPGAMWSAAIASAVRKSKFGILCVTSENVGSHWLQFEAGALWRGATESSAVCPVLLGIDPADLPDTLKLFHATRFDERGIKELCRLLATRTRLDLDKFRYGFETTWPSLKRDVEGDLRMLTSTARPNKALQPTSRVRQKTRRKQRSRAARR
jgi:hypothetical protein